MPMKDYEGLKTPYETCVTEHPDPKSSEGTSFGDNFVEGAPAHTEGQLKEVQFADVPGGEPGAKTFVKIPGS